MFDFILHFSNLNPKMIWTTTYHHLTITKSSEPKNFTLYFESSIFCSVFLMDHKRKFEVEKSRFSDRWWCLSNPRVHVWYWIYLLFLLHFNQVSITICNAEWTCLYVAEVILCIHRKHYKSDLNGIIFVSSHTFLVLIQAVTFFWKLL